MIFQCTSILLNGLYCWFERFQNILFKVQWTNCFNIIDLPKKNLLLTGVGHFKLCLLFTRVLQNQGYWSIWVFLYLLRFFKHKCRRTIGRIVSNFGNEEQIIGNAVTLGGKTGLNFAVIWRSNCGGLSNDLQ